VTLYEILSLTTAVLGLIVSTVVLLLLLGQLRLLAQQVKDSREALDLSTAEAEAENRRRRQRATVEFIAATLAKLEDNYDRVPAAGSERLADFLNEARIRDSSDFRALRNYLNNLQSLAVGVNLEIFDIDVVSRTVGGRIVRTWNYYEGWILEERKVIQAPKLFRDLELCAATIRSAQLRFRDSGAG
jgi:hypothetical protein